MTRTHILFQESTLKKRLKTKKKKKLAKDKDGAKNKEEKEQDEEEEGDGNEGEQENSAHRVKASSALIPRKKGKIKRKTKVKEETLDTPDSPNNGEKKGCNLL